MGRERVMSDDDDRERRVKCVDQGGHDRRRCGVCALDRRLLVVVEPPLGVQHDESGDRGAARRKVYNLRARTTPIRQERGFGFDERLLAHDGGMPLRAPIGPVVVAGDEHRRRLAHRIELPPEPLRGIRLARRRDALRVDVVSEEDHEGALGRHVRPAPQAIEHRLRRLWLAGIPDQQQAERDGVSGRPRRG